MATNINVLPGHFKPKFSSIFTPPAPTLSPCFYVPLPQCSPRISLPLPFFSLVFILLSHPCLLIVSSSSSLPFFNFLSPYPVYFFLLFSLSLYFHLILIPLLQFLLYIVFLVPSAIPSPLSFALLSPAPSLASPPLPDPQTEACERRDLLSRNTRE